MKIYNKNEYLCGDTGFQEAVIDELLDENIQLMDTICRIKEIVSGDYEELDPQGLTEIRRLIKALEAEDV